MCGVRFTVSFGLAAAEQLDVPTEGPTDTATDTNAIPPVVPEAAMLQQMTQ
jgi:hypothetical protein